MGFQIQAVQKTLTLILAKLINPNGINLEGSAAPHTKFIVTRITQCVSVTSSTSVIQSSGATPSTRLNQ